MSIAELIVDAVARIVVPVIIALISCKVVKNISNTRLDNIEKEIREHIRGCSDEEVAFIDKTLKEVFSKPHMRW